MRILTLLISILFLSCATSKKCKEKYPCLAIKDSVVTTITEKTYTITVHDTLSYVLDNPCRELCDSFGQLRASFDKTVEGEKGTRVRLFVKNNKLKISDSLNGLKIVYKLKDTCLTNFSTNLVDCRKEHRTKWDYFCERYFWVSIGALVLFLVFKYSKF